MPYDSLELVRSASRGDERAVDALLERHLPALRAFVRLRADPALRARESDSDIVQSTCRAILQRAGQFRFDGEEGFRRWLFTTALRTLIDKGAHWRTQKREQRRLEGADELDQRAYSSPSSPSGHAQARETQAALERALDALQEEEREVITLSRIVGLSHREIALAMGRSENAARILLHRSLLKLSKKLEIP